MSAAKTPLSSFAILQQFVLVLLIILVIENRIEDKEEVENDYDFHITRRPRTEISPRAIAVTHFGYNLCSAA